MSGPLTDEKKDRIAADHITKQVNKRYAAFAKYHPGAFEIRDALLRVIRERVERGGNYSDAPLEKFMANEQKRIAGLKIEAECEQRRVAKQRKQTTNIHDPYYGMAIGLLSASAKTPEMKALIHGLSGIPESTESDEK